MSKLGKYLQNNKNGVIYFLHGTREQLYSISPTYEVLSRNLYNYKID